jgi:hypothetical protein
MWASRDVGACPAFRSPSVKHTLLNHRLVRVSTYVQGRRVTSLIRNTQPPRITIGPSAQGYCRVLRGGGGLMSEVPL